MEALLSTLTEQLSSDTLSGVIGALAGAFFGAAAQQSKFCMRAACVEVWQGRSGSKLPIWLIGIGVALTLTQFSINSGALDTSDIRKLNQAGSLSGAVLGGLLFGVGMIMTRGCVSRMLVLSAQGNLRALVTGLIVAAMVSAALWGPLRPLRDTLRSIGTVSEAWQSLAAVTPAHSGTALGVIVLVWGLQLARRNEVKRWPAAMAAIAGAVSAWLWMANTLHTAVSFEIVPVQGLSFAGPSANVLSAAIGMRELTLNFASGLLAGVFTGALLAALISREFQWESFTEQTGTARYLLGAVMMGFGATLTTGCSVGAGLGDGALMMSTAWLAVLSMWLGAGFAVRKLPLSH